MITKQKCRYLDIIVNIYRFETTGCILVDAFNKLTTCKETLNRGDEYFA